MTLTRRRFFTLASAACLAPVAGRANIYRWHGTALGAKAQIILDHSDAPRIVEKARAEISRLEDIFSLYRPHSELSRLNTAGRLVAPSFELLDCLALARNVHRITEARFDPTVQPLWRVLAAAVTKGTTPGAAEIAAARALIGFERLRFDSAEIRLGRGQQLTLNGIAQGYIADRTAALLQREGITDVLIDTGEIVALGAPAGTHGWPIGIANEPGKRPFSGRALATSATFGTRIGAAQGHILDPRRPAPSRPGSRQISVSAHSAGLADGLSTGLALTSGLDEARRLIADTAGVKIESY